MFVRKSCSRDKSAGALSHSFFFLYMLVWTSGAHHKWTSQLNRVLIEFMLFVLPISYTVRHRVSYMIKSCIRVHACIQTIQHIGQWKKKENCLHGFLIFTYQAPINSKESTKGCGSLAKYTIFDPPNLVRRTSALIATTKIMYEIGLSPEQLSV